MDQQTVTTIASCAGVLVALVAYLNTIQRSIKTEMSSMRVELKGEMNGMRGELKSEMSSLRVELKGDIGKVEDRLTAIESRTYDISARLPPLPASSSGS